jgi:hypothetical protein
MAITVKQVTTKRQLRQYVKFPFGLYAKDSPWIPPLVADEMSTLALEDNPNAELADVIMFLAYKDAKIVGRITGIINRKEVEHQGLYKARFGWLDFIDDLSVSKILLETVENWAKELGMQSIEGPMGFTNFDKTGYLIEGFDEESTISTIYNHPYYIDHLKTHEYELGAKYVEYEIKVPENIPEKVERFSQLIEDRYKLTVVKERNKAKLQKYWSQLFTLINTTHSRLHGFIPFTEIQMRRYTDKFIKLVNVEFIVLITDPDDKLIAYALSIPSFGSAFKKARGRLYPFGIFHIMNASRNAKLCDLLLIGVDDQFRSKGVTALIFKRLFDTYTRNGVLKVESNPELEDNLNVRTLWKNYEHRQHKKRSTFVKSLP